MTTKLPDVLYRQYQIDGLSSFLQKDPSVTAPNLFIHGASSTGKTYILRQFFKCRDDLVNVWLQPVELVSFKPLLQAVARSIIQKLRTLFPEIQISDYNSLDVEEPFLLVKFLQNLFEEYSSVEEDTNLFLIFDGIDSLQDIDASILLVFIKLNELLPFNTKLHLKCIYVVQDSSFLDRYASHLIPTIIFPRYNSDEIFQILALTKASELVSFRSFHKHILKLDIDDCDDDQFTHIAMNFIQLVVQTFHPYTGNDLAALNDLIDFKWKPYLEEITKENIFEPLSLYRSTLKLFLSTNDSLADDVELESYNSLVQDNGGENQISQTYELSTLAKYLLIAAYICSYLEPRYDNSIFSRRAQLKSGRASYGRRKKMETNPRYLAPSLFQLERLLSIFQAIYPMESETESGSLSSLQEDKLIRANIEVFQNLSELHALKLIATTVVKNIDFLSQKLKWKVNVPWEIISEISTSVGFEVGQYFSGIHD